MTGPIEKPWPWLVALFVLQGVIFYTQIAGQIAPIYPANHDQLGYMLKAYELIDQISLKGVRALKVLVTEPYGTTLTFPLQGAIVTMLFGESRAGFLSTNLIYFILLQIVIFVTVRRAGGRNEAAWLALAILMSFSTLFYFAGSLFDYRMDFPALCIYGIWVCALSWTDGFASRKYSLIAGGIGAWLVLMRFIALAYVGPVMALLFAIALVAAIRHRRSDQARDRAARALNAFLSGGIIAVVFLPVLLNSLQKIINYYVVGHLTSIEPAIRAREVGIVDLIGHLTYYPTSLINDHIGKIGLILIGYALIVAIAGKLMDPAARRIDRRYDLLIFSLAIAVPITILTLDESKSQIAVNIVLVPLLLLVMTLWRSFSTIAPPHRFARAATYAAIAVGVWTFAANASAPRALMSPADNSVVERLNSIIAASARQNGQSRSLIAFDRITDYMNIGTVEYYHRALYGRGNKAKVKDSLGKEIFAVSRDQALSAVRESDIVVLSGKTLRRASVYPFDHVIEEYSDDMLAYATGNMAQLGSGTIAGIEYRLFARSIELHGLTADAWITADGVRVVIDRGLLRSRPFVVLEGASDVSKLRLPLKPSAFELDADGKRIRELPVSAETGPGSYKIKIDAGSISGGDGKVTISLDLNSHFVPKDLGINPDTRRLAVMAPARRSLERE